MRFRLAAIVVVVAAFAVPATASASEIIDRNASNVTLKVASNGQALVSYNARGKRWNVLAWGAVNAIQPTPSRKQVEFKIDYSGGYGTYKRDVWKTFKNACRAYDGPKLAVVRDRVQGLRRLLLGAPGLAADAPQLRPRRDPEAGRLGASALALERPAAPS